MRTVLIVDDDESMRFVIAQTIKSIDPSIRILEAVDGNEAFGIYKINELPDIIITDLHMPKMKGDRLAKMIRASTYGVLKNIYLFSGEPRQSRWPENFNAIFNKEDLFLLKKQLLKDYYGKPRTDQPGLTNSACRNREDS